jgi:3-hydroxymyristoyl/3-hydroxydecanoyl-(acyl carrier protein) dehydratase
MSDSFQQPLRVAANHPCLAGHFPGNPVVPGVLLLERVLRAAEHWLGRECSSVRLPQVKFLQPLLPEQDAMIELQRISVGGGERIRFRIEREGALLASGELESVE